MTASASNPPSSEPRYAPDDPSLPKPWKGLVDGSTGYIYYWNPVTNVTQYERPVPEQLPPPPPPLLPALPPKTVSSSVQVFDQPPAGGGGSTRRGGHEDDGRRSGSRGHQYLGSKGGGSHIMSGPTNVGLDSSIGHGRGHGAQSSRVTGRGRISSDSNGSLAADTYRRQHEISVTGEDVPAPYTTFDSTDFPSEILREVRYLLPGGANVVRCTTLCCVHPLLMSYAAPHCAALTGDASI
ncbi:putative RNA helicase [Dioscorea sansibarensis]